ncbi:MAG: hypothetical protein RIE32_14390 [Phycisphaerales bacterium]
MRHVATAGPFQNITMVSHMHRTDRGSVLVVGPLGAVEIDGQKRVLRSVDFDWWPAEVDRQSLRPSPFRKVKPTQLDDDEFLEFVRWDSYQFTTSIDAVDHDGSYLWSLYRSREPLEEESEFFDMMLLTTANMHEDLGIIVASGFPTHEAIILDARAEIVGRQQVPGPLLSSSRATCLSGGAAGTVAIVAAGDEIVRMTAKGVPIQKWKFSELLELPETAKAPRVLSIWSSRATDARERAIVANVVIDSMSTYWQISLDDDAAIVGAKQIHGQEARYREGAPLVLGGREYSLRAETPDANHPSTIASVILATSERDVGSIDLRSSAFVDALPQVVSMGTRDGIEMVWLAWGPEIFEIHVSMEE